MTGTARLLLATALVMACSAPASGAAPASTAVRLATVTPRPTGPSLQQQSLAAPTDAAGKPMAVVWMGEHYFSPSTLTIPVGTTVLWWMVGQQEHDVWAFDGSFHSPTMGPGAKYTHTFTTAGRFPYLCVPHNGDGMQGEVIVTAGPGG